MKELHADGGLNMLLEFLGSRPYIEADKLSCGGALMFIIGIIVAHLNIHMVQFNEGPSKWDSSRLSFEDLGKLEDLCRRFLQDVSRKQGPTGQSHTSTHSESENTEGKKSKGDELEGSSSIQNTRYGFAFSHIKLKV